ncbi:hypothetical protein PJP10_31285, partial [Mycobacterium kansasii]
SPFTYFQATSKLKSLLQAHTFLTPKTTKVKRFLHPSLTTSITPSPITLSPYNPLSIISQTHFQSNQNITRLSFPGSHGGALVWPTSYPLISHLHHPNLISSVGIEAKELRKPRVQVEAGG